MICECGCGQRTTISRRTDARRGWVKGQPKRFHIGHYLRDSQSSAYYTQTHGIATHRLRAEQALGKPLPVGAIVHHADGSKDPDAQLVICPNDAYHFVLHARMRIREAGGNPWADLLCSGCKQALPWTAFVVNKANWSGRHEYCRPCDAVRQRTYRMRAHRRQVAAEMGVE